MEETRIRQAARNLTMPREMKARLLERTDKAPVRFRPRRYRAALLAAALCLALTVPVLAATVEPIYQLMYQAAPAAAQFFQPVQMRDVDQGIQLEVVSANVSGSTAQIYVGLRDLEGDRIDETVDLYDSYSIHRPFDSTAHCERVGYDEATKTALFLITIEEWGSRDIIGDKITFSLQKFLSRKQVHEDVTLPVDLSALPVVMELAQNVQVLGGSGEHWEELQNIALMAPGTPAPAFPVEGIELTGAGLVDGQLHVQLAVPDHLDNDNHAFLYLIGTAGKRVPAAFSTSFLVSDQEKHRVDYTEFVFDLPGEGLAQYHLSGDFYTSGLLTQGSWKVTFPLEAGK